MAHEQRKTRKTPARSQVDAIGERLRAIVELTDAFCDAYLNDEYKLLCREAAETFCEDEPRITRGKPESWAAGIVCAIGWVNFLDNPTTEPHLSRKDVASGFGVSQGTMYAKSRIIRSALELFPFHPDWCLPSRLDDNPLVWFLELNGVLVDVREMPYELQALAYEQGLIPHIPADQEPDQPKLRIVPVSNEPAPQPAKVARKKAKRPLDDGPTLF